MAPSQIHAQQSPRSTFTAKGGRTRQRIVATAAELAYRHGVAGTTMHDVRELAAVSNSQLYHYFSDKQALIRAVVEHQGDRVVARHNAEEIDSLEALIRWRDELLDDAYLRVVIGGCPLGTVATELADADPDARTIAATEFDHWKASIAHGLERMRDRGELSPQASPADLATALLAAIQGGLLLSRVSRSNEPLQKALDAMITLIKSQMVAPMEQTTTVAH
jgi:TetR/AcrR family transcriptional repressor of nem operon